MALIVVVAATMIAMAIVKVTAWIAAAMSYVQTVVGARVLGLTNEQASEGCFNFRMGS